MATQPIDTFYCKLQDVTPAVWRLVQIPQNRTVAQLGYIMLTLFEMQANHLFDLQVLPTSAQTPGFSDLEQYTVPMDELDDNMSLDATAFTLKDAFTAEATKAVMNYDYGDSWSIKIVLVDVATDSKLNARELPRVVAGAGFGIVEDVGGADALMKLHRDMAAGTVSAAMRDWLGDTDFDLTAFDQTEMNQRLKKLPRVYKQVYEDHKVPSAVMRQYIQRLV